MIKTFCCYASFVIVSLLAMIAEISFLPQTFSFLNRNYLLEVTLIAIIFLTILAYFHFNKDVGIIFLVTGLLIGALVSYAIKSFNSYAGLFCCLGVVIGLYLMILGFEEISFKKSRYG